MQFKKYYKLSQKQNSWNLKEIKKKKPYKIKQKIKKRNITNQLE